MPKIALCDDNGEERAHTGTLLREYAQTRPGTSIRTFSSGQQLLLSEESTEFDLYILDVVMPKMSGIELGVRLREQKCRGAIIYLTVTPEFAINSYEARAFYYLLKPVDPKRLFNVMDQALAETQHKKTVCITVKTKNGSRLLEGEEIAYVELADRVARYHLSDGTTLDSVMLRRSFRSELEPLLRYPSFVPCGASFVANLRYVTGIDKGELQLCGGLQIPLPRGQTSKLRQQWMDYWLDGAMDQA